MSYGFVLPELASYCRYKSVMRETLLVALSDLWSVSAASWEMIADGTNWSESFEIVTEVRSRILRAWLKHAGNM